MTIWSPDTCDCKIEYNFRGNWIKSIKKCRLHKLLNGQNHLDTVKAQNQRFNQSITLRVFPDGVTPDAITLENIKRIDESRHVNKLRIRSENLNNFDEHLPHEQTLTFFQNLKRVLRLNP